MPKAAEPHRVGGPKREAAGSGVPRREELRRDDVAQLTVHRSIEVFYWIEFSGCGFLFLFLLCVFCAVCVVCCSRWQCGRGTRTLVGTGAWTAPQSRSKWSSSGPEPLTECTADGHRNNQFDGRRGGVTSRAAAALSPRLPWLLSHRSPKCLH
jgi:hypothetical protein